MFDIDESNGRILTKEPLNTEANCSQADVSLLPGGGVENCNYTVIVEVRDGLDTDRVEEEEAEVEVDDRITVTITVRDEVEVPVTPTVTVTSPTDVTKLRVNWEKPENTGPTITGYDVQYRKGRGSFSSDDCRDTTSVDNCIGITDTDTTITGLEADTSYSVQVRARNAEGASAWSSVVTVKTNKNKSNGDPNQAPEFTAAGVVELSVSENTSARQPIGDAVTAAELDSDSDKLTYSLDGRDKASFGIDSGNGQILTRAALNHEEKTSYSVRVKVVDGDGGSDSQDVSISVDQRLK